MFAGTLPPRDQQQAAKHGPGADSHYEGGRGIDEALRRHGETEQAGQAGRQDSCHTQDEEVGEFHGFFPSCAAFPHGFRRVNTYLKAARAMPGPEGRPP